MNDSRTHPGGSGTNTESDMNTTITINDVRELVNILTDEQQQVLKDTIIFGGWGDADYEFIGEDGKTETVGMYGYCTNDAKQAGHFQGRKISGMFRSIYNKLCPEFNHQIGKVISHCNDWWGDGSGDMLFIRYTWVKAFEEWAKC